MRNSLSLEELLSKALKLTPESLNSCRFPAIINLAEFQKDYYGLFSAAKLTHQQRQSVIQTAIAACEHNILLAEDITDYMQNREV